MVQAIMAFDKNIFNTYSELSEPKHVTIGDGTKLVVKGSGTIIVKIIKKSNQNFNQRSTRMFQN